MSGRDEMLADIRRSLGRNAGAPPPPPPPVRIVLPDRETEERIESFRTALEKLAATTFVAETREEAGAHVREFVGDRLTIATNSEILRSCSLSYPEIATEKAEVGITGADYGLADTGSLVVLASSDPRLASLLPPVHIAVLPIARMLSGLDELFTVIPRPADLSASMVIITGPSRTGDIEQILVRGVHGPGELHVVLLR